MRLLQLPIFTTLFLLLPPFANAINNNNTSTFTALVDSLSNLGYHVKAANTFGALNPSTAADAPGAGIPCASACHLLGVILPNITSPKGSPSYNQQEASYWSARQAETQPTCRVQPQSAIHVSVSLRVTKFFGCPFAVKSGGHAMFAGASNIQGGLTIDLAQLNRLEVSQDKTLTYVGAGNRWIDVYSKLGEQQLAVIGGRVAGIGVGGSTLGGGISFFSGRYGWACDNVRNYELVLANATITNVNRTSNPPLYFALRGGGNNFGIVTRFDLETYPQGPMWGGSVTYPISAASSLIAAFDAFIHPSSSSSSNPDQDAALIQNFVYYNATFFSTTLIDHAKPTSNPPPVFHNFTTAIPNILSTTRIANLTDLVLEIEKMNPSGLRQTYRTATFKPSIALTEDILEIYKDEVSSIKDVENVLPAITLQPITRHTISQFGKNGGNALGISESDGPLMLLDISTSWTSPHADPLILSSTTRFITRCNLAAQKHNLDHRFIYQNYAGEGQSVFAGYGAVNRARLLEVSRGMDPEGVFWGELQPGYFKL